MRSDTPPILRDDDDRDQILLPPARIWAAAGVVVALCVVGLVMLAVPTSSRTRIATLPYEPLTPPFVGIPVQLEPDPPLVIVSNTGRTPVRRVEIFTELLDIGRARDLEVVIRSTRNGVALARARVSGNLVRDRGITIVRLPDYETSGQVEIEISSPVSRSRDLQPILVQGVPGNFVGGTQVKPYSAPPQVLDVSVSLYGSTTGTAARLGLMYERSVARWPGHNRWLVPLALILFAVTAITVVSMLLATAISRVRGKAMFAALALVCLMLFPTVLYVLQNR